MNALSRCAVFMAVLAAAGCTSSERADEVQALVSQVVDCKRLPASVAVEADGSLSPGRAAAPVGPELQVTLRELGKVSAAVPPGRKEKAEGRFAGLVPFHIETGGTYALLVASMAWADLGEGNPSRLVKPQDFQWITLCGRKFKSGLYKLEAGKSYFVQLWDSPDRELTLMIRRLS